MTLGAGDSLVGVGADVVLSQLAEVFGEHVDEAVAGCGFGKKGESLICQSGGDRAAKQFALGGGRDWPKFYVRGEDDLLREVGKGCDAGRKMSFAVLGE